MPGLDLVKDLLVCLCGCWPRSDCSLPHYFQYFLAWSPSGASKFAKDNSLHLAFASASAMCGSRSASYLTKICCFLFPLQQGSTKSDGASFLLWDSINRRYKTCLCWLQCTNSQSAANCIPYVAVVAFSSLDHITRSSAYNAALMPLGSSDTTSLMKSRNNVGDRILPVEPHALVELSYCELCLQRPAVAEVGLSPVEHVTDNCAPQQSDK